MWCYYLYLNNTKMSKLKEERQVPQNQMPFARLQSRSVLCVLRTELSLLLYNGNLLPGLLSCISRSQMKCCISNMVVTKLKRKHYKNFVNIDNSREHLKYFGYSWAVFIHFNARLLKSLLKQGRGESNLFSRILLHCVLFRLSWFVIWLWPIMNYILNKYIVISINVWTCHGCTMHRLVLSLGLVKATQFFSPTHPVL